LLRQIRVLVVDDHPLTCDGTRQILERQADLRVVAEARDVPQAETLAADHQPDVALVDGTTTSSRGLEAARAIHGASPRTAILMLTAYEDEAYLAALREAGVTGHLLKNARCGALVAAVRALTQAELPIS
jgi:two-component system, NarL family, response regulator LiaR